jgi:hypothetical protein
VALHPTFASQLWDTEACAALIVTGPKLNAVRRRLNDRAGQGNGVTCIATVR